MRVREGKGRADHSIAEKRECAELSSFFQFGSLRVKKLKRRFRGDIWEHARYMLTRG